MVNRNGERPVQIHFRVTPGEYEKIQNDVSKSGLRLSEYARRILKGETVVAAPPVELNYLIRELKRIGSNLNQLLKKLNVLEVAHPLELERCAGDIQEILNLIYDTYRPKGGED